MKPGRLPQRGNSRYDPGTVEETRKHGEDAMNPLVSEQIEEYARQQTTPVPELLNELREVTYAKMELPQMQVGILEGTFLQLLVRLSGARHGLEIGMFTGYSTLMMAAGLPDDGRLITCDVDPVAEEVARSFFTRSPHGDKIEIRMGPALETLDRLDAPLDFVFIDADKQNYSNYFDRVVPLVRSGGWIAADNTLWSGAVIEDPASQDGDTRALVEFSRHMAGDDRVDQVLLTVRDGITLLWKK
jgi:caffeoyl-CoA O-methyltransferase